VTVDQPRVLAVSRDGEHGLSKSRTEHILLLAGLGVEGDAHSGKTMQHLSRVKVDPTQLNLRQVHLIHAELLAELGQRGFDVQPGQLGENITTQHLNLLALPLGTQLCIGAEAVIEVTGLRNPCAQINGLQPGLLNAVFERDENGVPAPKVGIMSAVLQGGLIKPGDDIEVRLPAEPHQALKKV
jgi:MOSC domain-containing protein YiiM